MRSLIARQTRILHSRGVGLSQIVPFTGLIAALCAASMLAVLTATAAHAQEDGGSEDGGGDGDRGNIAERGLGYLQDDFDNTVEGHEARRDAEECEGWGRASQECRDEAERVAEGPEGSEHGFSREARGEEVSYKQYPLNHYQFAFFVAEEGNIVFNSEQSAQNALSDALNGIASTIFVNYVVIMRSALMILEWVLTINLIQDLQQTIASVMTNLGEGMIGGAGSFSVAVKIAWLIGMGVITAYVFRARVASALATFLTMVAITAFTALIVFNPTQVINWYSGFTNELSSEVLSWASPEEERSGGADAVSEDFLEDMWEAYVVVPFSYIQVSSDPATAEEYDGQALATPPDDQRVNALEEIKDEPGVEDRASSGAWAMHLVWASVTLLFGLAMAALLIAVSMIVLMFEFIALVALMTLPFWLLLAIIPAGGMPRQMIGWFLNINLDVILAHLILALFVAFSQAVMTVDTSGEDIMLLTRFLLSLGAGIAVIMLVFSLRSVVQASSFGRSGMLEKGGLSRRQGGAGIAALAASKGLYASAAGAIRSGSSSSDSGGTGPRHPEVEQRDGLLNTASGTNMDRKEKQRNKADRKERADKPLDDRSKKRKAAVAALSTTGSIAWKGTRAGTGAAKKTAKLSGKAAGRLSKAGMIAARSGFMPMETAAAFGGVAAAGVAGGAYGAAGAGKDKAKNGAKGLASRYRQYKEEKANAHRFDKDGEDLTEKTANRKFDDESERYDSAEESARQAYFESEQPNAAAGGKYPSQAPPGTPEGANYNPEDGTITMDASSGEEAPAGPAGYTRSKHTDMTPGQAPRHQHVWTPNKDAAAMRGEAYDRSEKQRRAQREEQYKAQGPSESGAWITDANGNMHRDYASRQERARDAREDRMRDEQREGIIAAGGSNFDEYHANNKHEMAQNPPQKQDNESQQNFERRKNAHEMMVRNYNPSRNAPPTAFSSSNPSLDEINQKDPKGFEDYRKSRLNQEFTTDERERVEEGRRRRDNPSEGKLPYDQVGYMETARADVKDGIRRKDSDGSIITGQKEPDGSGSQRTKFENRVRQVNDSWLKTGSRDKPG